MSPEENKALVSRFNEEVFGKRNLAAIDEFITPDQIDHSLPSNLPNTREGTRQAIAMTLKAFPDLNYQVEDMIADGDKVITRYTTRGTQRGPFGPIPPTRKRVAVSGIVVTRIADGKIVEQWGIDDRLAMLQQLGLIPVLFGFIFFAGFTAGMGLTVVLRTVFKKFQVLS